MGAHNREHPGAPVDVLLPGTLVMMISGLTAFCFAARRKPGKAAAWGAAA